MAMCGGHFRAVDAALRSGVRPLSVGAVFACALFGHAARWVWQAMQRKLQNKKNNNQKRNHHASNVHLSGNK